MSPAFADQTMYTPFSDYPHEPSESLLFGFDDCHLNLSPPSKPNDFFWLDSSPASYPPPSPATYSASPASTCSALDLSSPPQSFDVNAHAFPPVHSPPHSHNQPVDYSHWLVDEYSPSSSASASAPIAIPTASSPPSLDAFPFDSFDAHGPKLGAYSPSLDIASLGSFPDPAPIQHHEPSYTAAPAFSPMSPMWTSPLRGPMDDTAPTVRASRYRAPPALAGVFASASAPSDLHPPGFARAYSSDSASRRAESMSLSDDRDATVRRKRKISDATPSERAPSEDRERPTPTSPGRRSHLRPPKLAPSTWQLWFADWIQRQQATSDRKLNVAQAAKEAGAEYGKLSDEEKEPYIRRSAQLKEIREREHALWMQSLSPEDIKRENNFRAAQRKAGKSRRGNIKDPNAPRKPLSAYFSFIQSIRADPAQVADVFGGETETTRQSVLAAAKWREMSDEEKRPFLAQAEQDRLEYDAAKKLYDEATTGHTSGVSFSVLQGGGFVHSMLLPTTTSSAPGRSSSKKSSAKSSSAEPSSSESEGEDVPPLRRT